MLAGLALLFSMNSGGQPAPSCNPETQPDGCSYCPLDIVPLLYPCVLYPYVSPISIEFNNVRKLIDNLYPS